MKTLLAIAFVGLAGVFLATHFGNNQQSRLEASAYFDEATIDKNLTYSSERRLISWGSMLSHFGLLGLLACTSLGRRIAAGCERLVRRRPPLPFSSEASLASLEPLSVPRWLAAVLLTGFTYFILAELASIPFAVGRFYHLRAWGMTERSFGDWFLDHAKGLGVSAVTDGIVLVGLFVLLRWLPRFWWLAATVLGTALGVFYALVMPVLIDPIFNTFTPLSKTKWAAQESRVRRLIDEAKVPVQDVLVMDASRQSLHSNAYFTGFGATRRIVLYDNLLKKQTPDEIDTVVAHEIGHWRHDHIVKGIGLAAVGALFGFLLLAVALRVMVGRKPLYLKEIWDPAALFLILFLTYLGSWIALPVQNAVSRHYERQADAASLELAKHPEAFIAAEKKLAIDNLSNVAPLPFSTWLFASHPPAVDRIKMAEEWKK